MAPPPSPSSTSWHSAASSTGTTKSVSFALPPYSDSSSSGASFCSSSSSSSSTPGSTVERIVQPGTSDGSAKPRPESKRRSALSGRAFALQQSSGSDGATEQAASNSESPRSRILSRRSVKRLTIAPPSSPPTLPLPDLPPIVQPDGLQTGSRKTSMSSDETRVREKVTTVSGPETTTTPHTGLPYLAPSPLGVRSPDGFAAIGHLALQSSTHETPHNVFAMPQAPPAYNFASEPDYSASRTDTRCKIDDQYPSSISHPRIQSDAFVRDATGPKHPGLLLDGKEVDASCGGSIERLARLSMTSVAKSGIEPAPGSSHDSHKPINNRDSSPATETTWSERLRIFVRVYDKSDDSSHSLPRLHRIMEPFLLLIPLLISLYLLGSAIVPFEWWRARLSIARMGLAGQSADSDERMVDGEEVGLFGVWGWCVLNSDEVARCSQAKFGYTMDSLVDDIGFTNFSKGLLNLPNGIFYSFLVHSLAVTFCGLALLIAVHHSWKRNLINNSRHKAGWLQHGAILAAVLTSLAAYIVDKLFVFFVKEKLKLDITRQSSDSIVESGALPPCIAAATCLLLCSFVMSLSPNLILHLRRHHSFVRERDRAAEDSLERGEAETYLAEKLGKKKSRSRHLSTYSEAATVQTERSILEKRGQRDTLKAARYKKREQRAKATRRAKRRTLIQKRRSTWRSEKEIGDDDADSDISVEDYDDIEHKRQEKKCAREAAREAESAKRRQESDEPLKSSKRKPKNRLSRWYHGEDDAHSDDDERPIRRRDTLGRRLSTWFQEAPRPSKSKKNSKRSKKHKKADSDDDEVDEADDLDYDRILKMALQDPDKISLSGDQESVDWSDEEYLNWTDDDLKEGSSEGKKR